MPGILSNTRMGGLFKGGSPKVENPPSNEANFALQLFWIFGGILTVLIPAIYRTRKMNNYQQMYNMWNWEEAQQNYQQQQQQYYEQNYSQQYGYDGMWANGYTYQWEQMRGNYDINQCKWWQFNCFPYYINENGEPEPGAGWYPAWFSGWAVTEEEREQMLEDGESSAALKFVYAWQIIMFAVILLYGMLVIRQNRVMTGLVIALVVFANMCFLSMWMLADGSIITDGEYVQQIGFYGQFAVLMFITNFWYILFSVIFACVFGLRAHRMHTKTAKAEKEQAALVAGKEPTTGYTPMEEPAASSPAPAPTTSESKPATSEDGDYVKVV